MMWMMGSRCRPERCQRALDDFAEHGSTPGVLYVHSLADGEEVGYEDIRLPDGWVKIGGPEYMAGQCRAVQDYAPNARWYGMIADDNYARTPNFDLRLIEAAGDFGFAICASGIGKEWPSSIPGVMLWGRGLIDAVGWWAPPGIVHATLDETWKKIATSAGVVRHLPNVFVRHEQHQSKARPRDFTDTEPKVHWSHDFSAFKEFCDSKGIEDAASRIKEAMKVAA